MPFQLADKGLAVCFGVKKRIVAPLVQAGAVAGFFGRPEVLFKPDNVMRQCRIAPEQRIRKACKCFGVGVLGGLPKGLAFPQFHLAEKVSFALVFMNAKMEL